MRLSPVTSLTQKVFVQSSLICLLAGALIFGLSLQKIEHLPLDGTPLRFDSQKAFGSMAKLSKDFPGRTTWSDSRKRAAVWLKSEFANLGYEPQGLQFSEVIAANRYTGLENVYAIKRGTKHPDEIVAVAAHYDITDTTNEGAMDDASGVGIVLELARVFAKEPTDRTLLFLVTDSEEFGAFWGAHSFAKDFSEASKIIAIANFDFVAPEKQTKVLTLCDGLKNGFTPLWLRELALDSLHSVTQGTDTEAIEMTGALEFVERALQIPPADHGAFLQAGIPSFNWVGQTDNFAYEMGHYHHTPYDVVEALHPESFTPFGQGAERLLRSIDKLPLLPDDLRNSSYWKITENRYLAGWAVLFLHILAFIPFLAYSATKFGIALRTHKSKKLWATLKNEAKGISILLGSLLVGYVLILLLPALKVITQYETFPATQKSAMLYTPDFVAIILVVGAVLLVYSVFRRVFYTPHDDQTDLAGVEVRQALNSAVLTLIIFLAFLKNSYLAVLLLLPPAYFWMSMRHSKKRSERKKINALLLAGGSITFVVMAIVMGTIFHVGVVYWYLFLSAAYGLISAYTVVLFFMALTVMIRLFRAMVL